MSKKQNYTNKKERLKVFCDFDGTVVEQDICVEICREFGKVDKHLKAFFDGEYGLKTLWKRQTADFKVGLTEKEVDEFVDNYEIDRYAIDFFNYLQREEIPVMILSDGFDIYIKNLLKKADLANIPYRSNKLVFGEKKTSIIYPGASESCKCNAASCKRNAILTNSADDDIIVYIGDGISDHCAARHADIIFSKKGLTAYCTENKIPHYPYKSFYDIKYKFEEIIRNGKLKQRNDAYIHRKNAIEAE